MHVAICYDTVSCVFVIYSLDLFAYVRIYVYADSHVATDNLPPIGKKSIWLRTCTK